MFSLLGLGIKQQVMSQTLQTDVLVKMIGVASWKGQMNLASQMTQ